MYKSNTFIVKVKIHTCLCQRQTGETLVDKLLLQGGGVTNALSNGAEMIASVSQAPMLVGLLINLEATASEELGFAQK